MHLLRHTEQIPSLNYFNIEKYTVVIDVWLWSRTSIVQMLLYVQLTIWLTMCTILLTKESKYPETATHVRIYDLTSICANFGRSVQSEILSVKSNTVFRSDPHSTSMGMGSRLSRKKASALSLMRDIRSHRARGCIRYNAVRLCYLQIPSVSFVSRGFKSSSSFQPKVFYCWI